MLRIAAKGHGLIIYMALGLLLPAQTSWAGKAYVTDSFRISLRRGPSIENKILRFVSSGLPVEVLESQDGWNRVQVQEEDGVLEGWVLSRYLVMRRPWKDQTESLKNENLRLKQEIAHMKKEAIHGNGHTERLREDYDARQRTLEELATKNETLKSSEMNKWFVTGAVILFCGLISGLVVGNQQRKRKSLYF